MYRLTLEEKHATAWRAENEAKAKRVKQRVYRWAQYWGILRPDEPFDTQWRTEIRTALNIGSSTTVLQHIESVTDIQNPPVNVDDIWDEEILELSNGESCTTLLYITGDKECIMRACRKYGISSVSWESVRVQLESQESQEKQESQQSQELQEKQEPHGMGQLAPVASPPRPQPVSRDSSHSVLSRGASQHRGTTARPQDPHRVHERPRHYEGAGANPRRRETVTSHYSEAQRGQRGSTGGRGRGFTGGRGRGRGRGRDSTHARSEP
jgi:hypothetical protein